MTGLLSRSTHDRPVSLPGLGCEGTCTGPLWCRADFNHASVAFLPPVEIGEGFEAYQLIKHDHNNLES